MSSLNGKFISETYKGILHTGGETLDSSTFKEVYDGDGNLTKIKLSNSGVKLNDIQYPTSDGTNRQFLKTNGAGATGFSSLESSDIPDLSPNPAKTYQNIDTVKVDSKGRVVQITELITDEDDDESSDSISVTTYRQNAQSVYSNITLKAPPDNSWVTITLPEKWGNHKAGIFYIEVLPRAVGTAETRKNMKIVASPDKDKIYPALFIAGGENPGNDDWWGNGVQFSCPIGDKGSDKVLYIKILEGQGDAEIEENYNANFYLIAKQR